MTALPLKATRSELVNDLEAADFRVSEHLDGKIQAPAVVLACGNPYLTPPDPDPTFGEVAGDVLVVHLELFVVFRVAERDAMTKAVNRIVQDVLLAIDDRWVFRDASAPFRASNLNGNPPVCRIRIDTTVLITEGTD